MRASDLSPAIWNSIADLVKRSQSPREIYFCIVTKSDKTRRLVWAAEFGGTAIPMVSLTYSFAYYDTTSSDVQRRDDPDNPAHQTQIVVPKVGETIVVLDPWGAKRFPFCIGVVQSRSGYWEG